MILEDGEVGTVTSVSSGDLLAADSGIVEIINISDPTNPVTYYEEEWHHLESFE